MTDDSSAGGNNRTRMCELCLRDFPPDAIQPLKTANDTKFVCGECYDDHVVYTTDSDRGGDA